MIYYDTMTMRLIDRNELNDPIPGRVLDTPIDCEVWALTSVETDKNTSTGAKTMYRVATPFDLGARGSLVPAGWAKPLWSFLYLGKVLTVQGGFERHAVSGQLDHYEFVINDFAS